MTTEPGFSSRSSIAHVTQFPQRNEATMTDVEPGFSNSEEVKDTAPRLLTSAEAAELTAPPTHEPGFSNGTAKAAKDAAPVEEKPAAKKAAAKKSAKKA